ncbi:hypothetical protein SAMN03159341_112153 [Paenibacillus sp. 1_12]|uniref:class I SAM-dependent methyltransferase n=1 Tax=Paenibacillus sp. 1_12 TaxID=1566278 RepID=UPI0008EC3C98|nr:class I SAM-dependent methyltransferase [Paenibacillus sp. 1_12]SFL95577.1 hypothetical protein SAMN03159341_112153 [Paenibacillus sp. 1_12]
MVPLYQMGSVVLIAVMLLVMLFIIVSSLLNGISPMPSSLQVCRTVAAEINRVPRRGSMVEAGSGWGTLALHLVKHCPGWQLNGIENSLIPLWSSRLISRLFARDRNSLKFTYGDIYRYSYDHTDLVVCYLYPGAMKRLSPILQKQLPPGAMVISVCFAMPDWQPERIITCKDLYRTKVYVYSRK